MLNLDQDQEQMLDILKEINILKNCDCEQIVAYYGVFQKDGCLWIVMEYCGLGSLSDLMAIAETALYEDEIAAVMYDALRGLVYMHKKHKMHRDLKSGNLLLNEQGDCKLADFGVSAELDGTMAKTKTMIGTPYFMAPEVLAMQQGATEGYANPADIWSLGITAYELALCQPPLADIHPMRAIFMIPNNPPPTLPADIDFSPQFREFIALCLQKDPKGRPSAAQLLKSDFIKPMAKGNKAKQTILGLIGRTKKAIEDWQADEQRLQEAGGENYPDGTTKVVSQQEPEFETSDLPGGNHDAAQLQANYSQNDYDSGTMVVKRPAAAPAAYNDQMGTVVIRPGNNNNNNNPTTHLGTVRLTKDAPNNFGTLNASGTMKGPINTRAGVTGASSVHATLTEHISEANSLVKQAKNPNATLKDLDSIRSQLVALQRQDLDAINKHYADALKNLDTLRKAK